MCSRKRTNGPNPSVPALATSSSLVATVSSSAPISPSGPLTNSRFVSYPEHARLLADTLAVLHPSPSLRCSLRFQVLRHPLLSFPARLHLCFQQPLRLKRKSYSVLLTVLRYKFDTGVALSSPSRQAPPQQHREVRGGCLPCELFLGQR